MYNHDMYAHAFYEATALNPITSYRELSMLSDVFKCFPQLTSKLLFDANRLQEIETWLFADISDNTKRFIRIMVEDSIIDQINLITHKVRDFLIQDHLWNVCMVEVAQKIETTTYQRIKETVEQNYEGVVEFKLVINTSLKAGYRVFVNDSVIDLSVDGRLRRLIEEVNNG